MLSINVPYLNHSIGYVSPYGNKWEPYTDVVKLVQVQAAVTTVIARILGDRGVLRSCNAAFAALLGGLDFTTIWNDPNIWISYNSNTEDGLYGVTAPVPYHKEITIAAYPFTLSNPIPVLAATIVHELAHVNGAPGRPSKAAESTLPSCGFRDQYDSDIEGMVLRAGRNRLA
jgi:hypothetical protein